MNMQQFFDNLRAERRASEDTFTADQQTAADPFDGMVFMVDEMDAAADEISCVISAIKIAKAARNANNMHANTTSLLTKVRQLELMAESLQGVTKTHTERGVK